MALLLVPVSIVFTFATSLPAFLTIVFIFMFLFSVAMVYYNHLMLEFASEEKTSLDLATYTTLTNVFKPIGVFVSGVLAESLGFTWAYYLAALLAFLSALTCLALPRSTTEESDAVGSYVTES